MADGTEHKATADAPCAMPIRSRWTKARKAIFLEQLAATSNVTHAARQAGMSKQAAYRHKGSNPAFATAWRRALDIGFAELEMLILRHALHGSERTETVVDASGAVKQVKTVHSFSDGMAFRLLLSHRDEVERFRRAEAGRADPDDDVAARVRAEMAKVRARLNDDNAAYDPGKSGDGD